MDIHNVLYVYLVHFAVVIIPRELTHTGARYVPVSFSRTKGVGTKTTL